jgi:UDP-glucose 4-epimerase
MKTKALSAIDTVLITGGAGFIGNYIVKKFLKSGVNVHVLDNLSTGSVINLPAHPNLTFHHGSILEKLFLQSLKKFNFDLILHLASIVGMRLATKYQPLVYQTATTGTLNVMETFKSAPVVLFSSSAVYGMDNKYAVKEDQAIAHDQLLKYDGGQNGYACGKWEMEQLGLKAARDGRKILIVRPFNVIGTKQVGTYGMVVPTFIKQAIDGKPLTIFDDGFQIRSFSCVDTFIKCLFKIMKFDEVWEMGKNIINIGSRNGYSINDLAFIVLEETHSASVIHYHFYEEFFPNHKDVIYRVPDTTYGEKFYGKIEWPTLRDIVKNILNAMVMKAEAV